MISLKQITSPILDDIDKFKEELIKLISILEPYSLDIKELTSFNQTV